MTKTEAIKFYGGKASKLADVLGISLPAIYQWKNDQVPLLRQLQLQRITRGRLKADPLAARKGD